MIVDTIERSHTEPNEEMIKLISFMLKTQIKLFCINENHFQVKTFG